MNNFASHFRNPNDNENEEYPHGSGENDYFQP